MLAGTFLKFYEWHSVQNLFISVCMDMMTTPLARNSALNLVGRIALMLFKTLLWCATGLSGRFPAPFAPDETEQH